MKIVNNSSGKILTIFIVIIGILLIALTAVSLFFFKVEIDNRKEVEAKFNSVSGGTVKLQGQLEVLKKEKTVLEAKNKEADERINSLLDELELEKGLREEIKTQNETLQKKVDEFAKGQGDVQKKYETQLTDAEKKIKELESKFQAEQKKAADLLDAKNKLDKKTKELEVKLKNSMDAAAAAAVKAVPIPESVSKDTRSAVKDSVTGANIELGQIVVTPSAASRDPELQEILSSIETKPSGDNKEGRVLSVDSETEFVVVNVGQKDGVKKGDYLSIYRGAEYLGDVEVTRVQPEMAAADFVPPLSSLTVRKNDQVVPKQ